MEAPRYWKRQGWLVAWHYNLGWWLAAFLNFSAAASVVFACALLLLREAGIPTRGAWLIFGAILAVCALAAFFYSRRRFFTAAEGLVRLDVRLGLHSRLASAAAGVGKYPDPIRAEDGWGWRWGRMLVPAAGCALLVAAAALIPVGAKQTPAQIEPPSAWTQVESWVDRLDESGLVEKKAIEELREKLEGLKDRPAAEWYSQSALEAGDNLKEQSSDAIRALQRDLQSSSVALAALEQMGAQAAPADMKAAQQALDRALQGLELGTMPLNKDLLDKLKNASAGNLKTLTPKQLADMQKRLSEGAGVCKDCTGGAAGEALLFSWLPPKNSGGGVDRGPGSPPLTLNPLRSDLGTATTAALPSANLDRALPGEVVGVASGEHKVDPAAFHGPSATAAAASTGNGGEAVWRDDLTPDERGMLKRFFK